MNLEDIISGWNGCVCSDEGGGGGDIKTAHVTIICSNPLGAELDAVYGVIVMDDGILAVAPSNAISGGDEFDLVLNDGDEFHGNIVDTAAVTVVSGGITLGEVEEWDGKYETSITITGDCTITVTGGTLG